MNVRSGTDASVHFYEGATKRWTLKCIGSSNGFDFTYAPTGSMGGISPAGAWTLGPASTATTHVINGYAGAQTIASLRFVGWNNSSTVPTPHVSMNGVGNFSIIGTLGNSTTTTVFGVSPNADGSSMTVNGSYTQAGAWTLGSANAAATLVHTIQGGGGTNDGATRVDLLADGTGANCYMRTRNSAGAFSGFGISGRSNGIITGSAAGDACLYASSGNLLISANDGTTIHGKCDTAGAWTLGPSGGTGNNLTVNGYTALGNATTANTATSGTVPNFAVKKLTGTFTANTALLAIAHGLSQDRIKAVYGAIDNDSGYKDSIPGFTGNARTIRIITQQTNIVLSSLNTAFSAANYDTANRAVTLYVIYEAS
jgi:hypothetical protein